MTDKVTLKDKYLVVISGLLSLGTTLTILGELGPITYAGIVCLGLFCYLLWKV